MRRGHRRRSEPGLRSRSCFFGRPVLPRRERVLRPRELPRPNAAVFGLDRFGSGVGGFGRAIAATSVTDVGVWSSFSCSSFEQLQMTASLETRSRGRATMNAVKSTMQRDEHDQRVVDDFFARSATRPCLQLLDRTSRKNWRTGGVRGFVRCPGRDGSRRWLNRFAGRRRAGPRFLAKRSGSVHDSRLMSVLVTLP